MKNIFRILLIGFTLLLSNKGIACSCVGLGQISLHEFNTKQVIFKGEIISVQSGNFGLKAVFKVQQAFKGINDGDTLSVFTADNGGACGLGFTQNVVWLIYANIHEGKVHSGLCSRSKRFEPYKANEPKKLKNELKFLNTYADHTGRVNKRKAKGNLQNGLAVGCWRYFKKGKLYARTEYENGIAVLTTFYDEKGNVKNIYKP